MAIAKGAGSRAIGDESYAKGIRAVAQGYKSSAIGEYAFSNGPFSSAHGKSSIAEGLFASSKGDSSVAKGLGATAEGPDAFALGSTSYKSTLPKTTEEAEQLSWKDCSICLEPIDAKSIGSLKTSCSHDFHKACLVKWITAPRSSPTCPECRNDQVLEPALLQLLKGSKE